MLLWFNDISPHGHRVAVQNIQDLAKEQDFVVNGSVRGDCTLKREGEDKIVLDGRVEVDLLLPCDRCLRLYPFQVSSEFRLLFALASTDPWQEGEETSFSADIETELLDEPVIDLDDVLRQQVYLALPVKRLCRETCKGLCPRCGVNLNETACECERVTEGSPFAVLAQWKK